MRGVRARWRTAGPRQKAAWVAGAALLLLGVLLLGRALWGPEDESLQRIFESGAVRVGMDPSFPPFENLNAETGEVHGFDVDLAWALARELGEIQPQFVIIGFDGLYDALWARKVDVVISALPVDPMLTQDVAYSVPYFDAGLRLLSRAGSPVEEVESLAGRRLGVEWGSEADMAARDLRARTQGLELVSYLSVEEALEALLAGEVDAVLVEGVTALQFAGQYGQVALADEPLTHQPYAVALHPEDGQLLRAINEALQALQEDGTLERLQAKWLGAP